MTQQQLLNYCWAFYGRTIEETLEPIEKQVNGIQFRVLNPDVNSILVKIENPVFVSYRDVHHDAVRFSNELIGFYRAAGNNALLEACDMNVEQCDMIWQRWEDEIRKNPAMEWFGHKLAATQIMLMKL